MEKEFVPYEVALRLKALGFDGSCFAFYNGKFIDFKIWDDNGKTYPQINPNMDVGKCVSAPTFSQAFRWFREKYKMHIMLTTPNELEEYYARILQSGKDIDFLYKGTYEEAEVACLEKLLEIVENNKEK